MLLPSELISMLVSILGLFLIFDTESSIINVGIIYAGIAGIGYGAFIVTASRLTIGSGIMPLASLLLFGCLLLALKFNIRSREFLV